MVLFVCVWGGGGGGGGRGLSLTMAAILLAFVLLQHASALLLSIRTSVYPDQHKLKWSLLTGT